jgi:hypothetical protein
LFFLLILPNELKGQQQREEEKKKEEEEAGKEQHPDHL